MHGDLLYVTVVYVNVVMYCSSRYASLDGFSSISAKIGTPPTPHNNFFFNAPACIGFCYCSLFRVHYC